MVNRYDVDGDGCMDPYDDGPWVLYDDYQAQAARIEQLEAALIASITLITMSSDYEITVKELLERVAP